MKYLFFGISFFIITSLSAQKFVGSWIVTDAGNTIGFKNAHIVISEEGQFNITKEGQTESMTWQAAQEANVIKVIDSGQREMILKITYLRKKHLSIRPVDRGEDATITLAPISKKKSSSLKKLRRHLLGTWEVVNAQTQMNEEDLLLTFQKDGLVKMEGEEEARNWELVQVAENTILKLGNTATKNSQYEEIYIEYFNKDHFKLRSMKSLDILDLYREGTVKISRPSPNVNIPNFNPDYLEEELEALKEEEKALVGRWEVTKIAIEDIPANTMQIELKMDRVILTYENDIENPEKEGNWSLEDNNQVLVIKDGYNAEQLIISYHSENELILEDNGEVIMLKRIE